MRTDRTNIPAVDAALRQVEADSAAQRKRCPILDGAPVEDIRLEAGVAKPVPHPLKRRYRGYIVTARDADATVFQTRTSFDAQRITLTASDDVLVSIWIY